MKKITLLFLLIFAITTTQAQNYQISFAGTGASTTVDSVIVENLTQCTNTILGGSDILHLISTTGINDWKTDVDNTVHIYPNPMSGNCSVNFEATDQSKTNLELYDITGKRILQVQELLTKEHHTYSLTGISSGIYTLKIESDKYSYTAKIVSSNAAYGTINIKHIETTQGIDKQSTTSNSEKTSSLKVDKTLIDMQYTTGDQLKFTGFSNGIYRNIFMLVPTITQTVTFNFSPCTDADGNNYSMVQIGTQVWMAENLKYLPSVVSSGTGSQNAPYYYVYDYNGTNVTDAKATANYNTYGVLYNWTAAMNGTASSTANPSGVQGVCPTGWHLPSDAEWIQLSDFLGGASIAGGKLKEPNTTHWKTPNTGATNETGFTALPGGYRTGGGTFGYIRFDGLWWGATGYSSYGAWDHGMFYDDSGLVRTGSGKEDGFSIRCLKD